MPGIFIEDGFTLKGRVEPLPGLHGGVSFTYRPALPARVAAYLKADKSTPDKELAADIKLIREHVSDWDATEKGEGADSEAEAPAPLDEKTLRRVYYPVLQAMINHVCSYTASVWDAAEKN